METAGASEEKRNKGNKKSKAKKIVDGRTVDRSLRLFPCGHQKFDALNRLGGIGEFRPKDSVIPFSPNDPPDCRQKG